LAVPGLVLPGLGFDTAFGPTSVATTAPTPTTMSSLVPAATPTRVVTKPAAPKTAAPAAPAASAPATGEIASEQICPGQSDVSRAATALTCLTAQARVFHGLVPVGANGPLMAAAVAKNQDMLSCGYSHTACGKTFDYWMSAKGFAGHCTAENIAQGQATPRAVFAAWMQSPGHRANILNANYRAIGSAEVGSSNGPLWVMELGGC
jgi:uncharacterized protein YkwD